MNIFKFCIFICVQAIEKELIIDSSEIKGNNLLLNME